jgi:Flp pilus assembly protein TadD
MQSSRITLYDLRQAADRNPFDARALNALGLALADIGKLEPALNCLRTAIDIEPESAQRYRNAGWCLGKMDRLDEAIHYYRRAIALDSNRADYHRDLGLLYAKSGEDPKVIENLFLTAIRISPDDQNNYIELCRILAGDCAANAVLSRMRQLMISTGYPARFYHALAYRLEEYGRYDEVKSYCLEGLKFAPDDIRILTILGRAEIALGDINAATICYQRIFQSRPADPMALHDYITHLARLGEYQEARKLYREYMSAPGSRGLMARSAHNLKPEWNGSSLEGKTVLIKNSAGYGDAIQFIRFAHLLKDIGARVIIECQKPLRSLFKTMSGGDCVVLKYQRCPEFDFVCDPQYGGLFLDWSWERVTRDIPYFHLPAKIESQWKGRISGKDELKIGLCWMGGRKWETNHYRCRSTSLDKLRELSYLSNVSFYSLQVGREGEELISGRSPFLITDMAEGFRSFSDTAGAISALDLVISIDTAVAHLAGSLGKPCFLMLPYVACWRWMTNREDCLWYPTVRLFRQSYPGAWDEVISRIVMAVHEFKNAKKNERFRLLRAN